MFSYPFIQTPKLLENPFSNGLVFVIVLIFIGCSSGVMAQNLEQFDSAKPLKLSSGLNISTSVYHINGGEFRQQPFNWVFTGTPTLNLYGFEIPFSFYYSNQSLGYQQPFNQFGFSPSYKWARAHVGYSSVHFSDYTLAGRRFFGAGTELNPGKLRFGIVYGRFQDAVEQDSIFRPTPGNFLSEFPNGAFSRKAMAVKLGYGREDHFFDIIFMQGADDTTSLTNPISQETIDPESNLVIGFKHRMKLSQYIFWEADASTSYFTRDVRFPATDSVSLLPAFGGQDFQPSATSQLFYAGNTQLGYQSRNFRFALRYRRIARDFKTFGAYYFQTDLQEYGVSTNAFLFKRKANFRASLGWQSDNLDGTRIQTTSRLVGAFNAGWQVHTKLRLDGMLTNFGIQQRNAITGLLDSVRVDQVANSYQVQGRYVLSAGPRPQSIGASVSVQSLAPRSQDLAVVVDTRALQTLFYYTYMIPTYRIGLTANLHSMVHRMDIGNTSSNGGGLNGSYSLKSGSFSFNSGVRYFANSFESARTGSTWSFDGGVQGRISQTWNLGLQLRYLSTEGGLNNPAVGFEEFFAQANMGFSF
jgi:hypothetical protein